VRGAHWENDFISMDRSIADCAMICIHACIPHECTLDRQEGGSIALCVYMHVLTNQGTCAGTMDIRPSV
jgi:hypothetical protein